MWYYFTVLKNIGVSPSGKASDSDSDIPVFESQYPNQYYKKVGNKNEWENVWNYEK